ncbi:MAG TPA: penicillin-binding protein 1C, partial [Bacteroidia bacterium]|nr:penicillin-binding protein 1C [Bacteroidia bacterium]
MKTRVAIVAFIKRHSLKIIFLGVVSVLYYLWLPDRLFNKPCSAVLTDEKGALLSAKIASDGQWRFPQSDSVPQKFETCILTFEDEYFYYHPGFNPVSLVKSLTRNLSGGKIKSGGSTLTMQVARMMRHKQNRSYYQKIVEILLAARIELSYKKSSVLSIYCSNAPFGSNVVGLSAASWRYFGRAPWQLSWAENALLAVLPNAPSLIYPGKNQTRLLFKRNRLLKKLYNKNHIDRSTFELAVAEPLPVKTYPIPQVASHLLSRCIRESGSSQIFRSTLNHELQTQVAGLLDKHIQNLYGNQVFNACAIVAETESGKVLAYIGNSSSPGNTHENYVDVITSPRSTGSILKPFLYGLMLSENKILPSSLIEDVPTQIGSYGPKNFNPGYDGLVPANQAIARSLNVPAVKMLQDYGAAKFHQRLKQLGFKTFNKPAAHYGLALILGGGEATLWDLAAAYSSMGRALIGFSNSRNRYRANSYHPLYFLTNTRQPESEGSQKTSLISASAIYYTLGAMTELLRPQDYTGWIQFASKNRVAWKTGTSFGFRDAWAVGLNARYTVAVWVGNADGEGRPELTGTAAAAPLLFSIFNILPKSKWFVKPVADLSKIKTCRESGFKASEICDNTVLRYYPAGAEKTKPCPFHKLIHLDESGRWRVNSNCYPVNKMIHKAWFVASPNQEYFFKQHSLFYKPLPPYLSGCETDLNYQQLEIIYPREGFKIYIPVVETENRSR